MARIRVSRDCVQAIRTYPSPLLPKALPGIVATFALSSSLQEKSSLESPVPEMFGKR